MENFDQYAQLLAIVSDGSIVVFLTIGVLAFVKGWVIPKATHDEMEKKQQIIIDHMVEKIDERLGTSEEKFSAFTSNIGGLAENYYQFQQDWRDALKENNGNTRKMIEILKSIDEQLTLANGG